MRGLPVTGSVIPSWTRNGCGGTKAGDRDRMKVSRVYGVDRGSERART